MIRGVCDMRFEDFVGDYVFWAGSAQSEGRRHMHLRIKLPPADSKEASERVSPPFRPAACLKVRPGGPQLGACRERVWHHFMGLEAFRLRIFAPSSCPALLWCWGCFGVLGASYLWTSKSRKHRQVTFIGVLGTLNWLRSD